MQPINLSKRVCSRGVSRTTSTLRTCDFSMRLRVLCIAALLSVTAIASTAEAQQRFGSWVVTQLSDDAAIFVAATISSSGDILRKICGPGACLWMFTSKLKCQEGGEQGMLATSDGGTMFLDLRCVGAHGGDDGYYDTAFKDYNSIDRLIRTGRVIGFAMALNGGEFKVSRFITDGAVEAATEASRRAGTGRSGGSTPARGPKDERL